MTEGGALLYEGAEELLKNYNSISKKMEKFSRGTYSEITVAYYPVNFMEPLIGASRLMRQNYPEINVKFVDLPRELITSSYIGGSVDVVYGYRQFLFSDGSSAVNTIARNQMMAMIPKGHRYFNRSELTSQDLIGEPIASVVLDAGKRINDDALDQLFEKGISKNDITMFKSFSERLLRIADGEFIGHTGKYTDDDFSGYEKFIRTIPITDIKTEIADICVMHRLNDGASERFVDCMLKYCEDHKLKEE